MISRKVYLDVTGVLDDVLVLTRCAMSPRAERQHQVVGLRAFHRVFQVGDRCAVDHEVAHLVVADHEDRHVAGRNREVRCGRSLVCICVRERITDREKTRRILRHLFV